MRLAGLRDLGEMPEIAELNGRIQRLRARASSGDRSAALLIEIEDLLAECYLCALQGDQQSRRLKRRVEALVEAADSAHAARELVAVAREQRMASEATHQLRRDLAVMGEHMATLRRERLGLA